MNDPRRRPRDGTGGVWYKQNCTQKAAFIPILTSIAILLAIGCFRAFFFGLEKISERVAVCQATWNSIVVEYTVALAGFPSVLLMTILTGFLVVMLRRRNKSASSRAPVEKSSAQKTDNAVTLALIVNSVLYTFFNGLQLSLFIVDRELMGGEVWFIRAAQVLSAIGAAVRALSYLAIPAMRTALRKAIRNICDK
ncbi:uncharacterized protein LOC134848044 [Symsagittifera roscoffensis]|uniref:uncharacterized protein LOC134848044 n=1 Tax=Symsagittifera roscoffensis TaxID=84072 RepID=UPI00307B7364